MGSIADVWKDKKVKARGRAVLEIHPPVRRMGHLIVAEGQDKVRWEVVAEHAREGETKKAQ